MSIGHHSIPGKINGARRSVRLPYFHTSTGILSLDEILSGGVTIGSISLIEADFHETYAKQIIDLFVAEGLVSGHSLLYASRENVEQLLSRLPDVAEHDPKSSKNSDGLKIAWRYNKLEDIERTSFSTHWGHDFDLASTMKSAERIKEQDLRVSTFLPEPRESLIKNLSNFLHNLRTILEAKSTVQIHRVVLNSAFSPIWGYCNGSHEFERTVTWFLITLRLLVQSTLCVVYLTTPQLPAGLRSRVGNYVDYHYSLTGFDGSSANNTAYSEFSGLFNVEKLPWLGGTLEPIHRPITLEWAFKITRHKFVFQTLVDRNVSQSAEMEFISTNNPPDLPYLHAAEDTGEQDAPLLLNAQYAQEMHNPDVYHTGGYWLVGSEVMNGAFPTDHLIDVVFDPLEELVWCVTRMVLVIDPRAAQSIVRSLDAHTGEISDITVVPHGYTLVTCGWSRMGETGLRVDRLLKVYDLRSGRAQVPLSTSLDPCFTRFFPGCTDRLFVASQTGAFQSIQWGSLTFSPDDLGQLWLTYDRVVAMDISHNGNCAIFGTENGQVQLYVRDMNVCQFNVNPVPTEFASQLAESLLVTNGLGTSVPPNYPFWDDPVLTNTQPSYQTNPLAVLGRAAAEAVGLQLLAASLHQPAATSSDKLSTQELVDLVERKKTEAANEAVLVAYKPVEYDDYRFSSASIPFAFKPPPIETDMVKQSGTNGSDPTVSRNPHKLEQMTSSDWSEDLCPPRPRQMLPVDTELVISANRKRAVRKPANWGTVWHPYPPLGQENPTSDKEDTTLGRFVSVSRIVESQAT
ncbi:Elongator complex protein 4 [Fasciola gigantica]|uniref:Elongator complex protein 4 n=1 Tax=Fasciola gigantica TaxID=46835 RepID=A0A504Y7M9_FASGI|nr:Elongator complex protein 4 [Fasciola gigantica]